jgi:hypothetical protein
VPAGASPPCAAPDVLHGGERAATATETGAAAARVSAAAAHGIQAARARVGEVPGWRRALNSPGGLLGVRATHGEACSRRTRAAARPRPNPGRARRGGRDDMRVPPVSGSGRRRGAGKRAGDRGPAELG